MLGVGALLSAPLVARAAEDPPFTRVALLLPPCELPGTTSAELREAVALEIETTGLRLAPRGELAAETDVLVRVDASCRSGDPIKLLAEFGTQRHERSVELGALDAAQHARALSLSLAELLATFRSNLPPAAAGPPVPPSDVQHEEEVRPVTPTSAAPEPRKVKRRADESKSAPPPAPPGHDAGRREAWQPQLGPELRIFSGTRLWGARARVRAQRWIGGADLLTARASARAGDVTTWVVQLNAARALSLLGGGNQPRLDVEARLGAGVTLLHAAPGAGARGADALDVYLDVAVGPRASLPIAFALRLGLAAEVGYARGPVGRADGAEVARTAGPFAALLLDAALESASAVRP